MNPIDFVSIQEHEFNEHFFESAFTCSKMSQYVIRQLLVHSENDLFLSFQIPYLCLIESEKTVFKHIGKKYFYVTFECGVIEPQKTDTWQVMEGKTHGNV